MTTVLPTSNPKPQAAPERTRDAAQPVVFMHVTAGEVGSEPTRDPLQPIGPERLRALREAIRNGTYPSDSEVLGGLERMFARDE